MGIVNFYREDNNMKLKYKMTTMNMDGEIMAVPIECDSKFYGIIRMNDTTAEILELLKEETSEEQIIDKLLSEYDADRETIGKSVKKVIDVLKDNDLLD